MPKKRLGLGVLLLGSLILLAACTTPPVTKPKAFSFTDITAAEPGAIITSATVTIDGITGPAPAKVTTGGTLIINGLAKGTSTTVLNGSKLAVRVTASNTYGATVSVTVDVGGQKATFKVTTRAAHTTPGELTFPPITDAEPGATVTSNAAIVSEIEVPTTITVTGDGNPTLLINDTPSGTSATVEAGDQVKVQLTASDDFGTETVATITLEGVAPTNFTVTTRAAIPAAITLTTTPPNITQATPNQTIQLAWTITGDFNKLVLSTTPATTLQDLPTNPTGTTNVTIPSNTPDITYTLTATHTQLPGIPTTASTPNITIPLWVCTNPTDEITFADPSLETQFRQLPSMPTTGPITCANARTITTWEVTGWQGEPGNVQSLLGMQHLTNLEWFRAQFNEISDLTPLANLTHLMHLDLDGNRVTDVAPLADLTLLDYLGLWDNGAVRFDEATLPADVDEYCRDGITDISPLANLVNLETLYLSCNNIEDISALTNMSQLDILYLISNRITDIAPLAGKPNLRVLRLSDNLIGSDSGVFAGMTDLQWLQIAYNRLLDPSLTGLQGLQNLYAIDLEGNYFSDLSPLINNTDFPAPPPATLEPQEPLVATVSIGYNCIADPAAVTAAFVLKGVAVVGGPPDIQRAPGNCAVGPTGTGLDSLQQQMLQQYRERIHTR
ncbi:MAG TPA: hypothetical protein PK890_02920 [Terrimesophilobacter sp.]|nr:hypothetical protein [Terrimesophilobacter sp.]